MKKRPLLFIIIAALHIIEPLIKILYFKATTGFPLLSIFENVLKIQGLKSIFEFWFLFPVAGLALIGVKKWSYPIFVSIQAYSVYMHLTFEKFTWPYSSSMPHWYSLLILSLNVAIIFYFAIPEVRKPFFDKSMRWWETKTRFGKNIPCTVFFDNNPEVLEDAVILNISHTGAFIDYKQTHPENFVKDSILNINISFEDQQITLKAKIRAQHSYDNISGVGIEFQFQNIFENLYMKKIIKSISKSKKREEKFSLAA